MLSVVKSVRPARYWLRERIAVLFAASSAIVNCWARRFAASSATTAFSTSSSPVSTVDLYAANEPSAAASLERTCARSRPPSKIVWVSPANSRPAIWSNRPPTDTASVLRLPLIASAG